MQTDTTFTILAISGSLRRGSHNRALLKAARTLAPAGVRIDIVDLDSIPMYNPELEAQGDPEPVRAFKDRIDAADALLIATPEYNWSVPGVLKNALDWASRPPRFVLRHKPIAIMGATTGNSGTIRGQTALRQILEHCASYVLLKPEILVSRAAERFDEHGHLSDERVERQIRQQLEALVDWAHLVRPDSARVLTFADRRPSREMRKSA